MKTSLATGANLTPESWADFVERLTHDCRGEGVGDHCTKDAIFIVQAKRYAYGIDKDYDPELVIICEDLVWTSPSSYWNDCGDGIKSVLNSAAKKLGCNGFMSLEECNQFDILDNLEYHRVVGRSESWEYVCAHFTKDAADAFIKRKSHDYRDGLRVYVDSQYYSWEFNAIKNAIMDGRLVLSLTTVESKGDL